MLKKIIILLFIGFVSKLVAQPQLKFTETKKSFGFVKNGEQVKLSYVFTNAGNQPLIIEEGIATCSCTEVVWPKEPILPGKTGVIKVHYDTKRVGPISKTVSVQSNAVSGTQTIQIKGTVEAAPVEEQFPAGGNAPKTGAPVEKGNN